MKKRYAILIAAALAASFSLAGCGGDETFLDKDKAVKVVFNLEGGQYQNSHEPIIYYYGFKAGTENKIKNPAADRETDKFNGSTVSLADHYLDGWYRNRVQVDDGVDDKGDPKYRIEYTDKWDFDADRVDDDGIELYARWIKLIHYTYGVYYINDDGNEVLLGDYPDNEPGDKFDDFIGYAKKRPGWTPVGYFSDPECTVPWDPEFGHPGGDTNTEVKVYVKYTKGEFVEVRTAAELLANKFKDIKLMNDIDMSELDEEQKKKFAGSFSGYSRILDGNGFAIKNLDMTYKMGRDDMLDGYDIDESGNYILGISLFGISSGATIKNVKFENVTVDINVTVDFVQRIIVAPLFMKAERATVRDVTFSGTYSVSHIPDKITSSDNFEVVTDASKNGCFKVDSESAFENVHVTFTEATSARVS